MMWVPMYSYGEEKFPCSCDMLDAISLVYVHTYVALCLGAFAAQRLKSFSPAPGFTSGMYDTPIAFLGSGKCYFSPSGWYYAP